MNRIYGSRGQVAVDRTVPPPTTPVFVAIASLNKWTASLARAKADVTAFGDTNTVSVQGLPAIKGTLGGWFDTDAFHLLYMALLEQKYMLQLSPDLQHPTIFLSGLAFIDAAIDCPASGPVAITGTWDAAGPWTLVPIEVP